MYPFCNLRLGQYPGESLTFVIVDVIVRAIEEGQLDRKKEKDSQFHIFNFYSFTPNTKISSSCE